MMVNNELIADKIEELIGKMFADINHLDSGATEYSIFNNPQKHESWFIVIFFQDSNQLKEGIKNGTCYHIHSFLKKGLGEIYEISNIDHSIFFESGNRPVKTIEIDFLFEKLLTKVKPSQNAPGETGVKICDHCGHDFDKHKMLFNNLTGKIDVATEGWIMCPEENCNCFLTWGINYKADDNLRKENKGSLIKRVLKKLFG